MVFVDTIINAFGYGLWGGRRDAGRVATENRRRDLNRETKAFLDEFTPDDVASIETAIATCGDLERRHDIIGTEIQGLIRRFGRRDDVLRAAPVAYLYEARLRTRRSGLEARHADRPTPTWSDDIKASAFGRCNTAKHELKVALNTLRQARGDAEELTALRYRAERAGRRARRLWSGEDNADPDVDEVLYTIDASRLTTLNVLRLVRDTKLRVANRHVEAIARLEIVVDDRSFITMMTEMAVLAIEEKLPVRDENYPYLILRLTTISGLFAALPPSNWSSLWMTRLLHLQAWLYIFAARAAMQKGDVRQAKNFQNAAKYIRRTAKRFIHLAESLQEIGDRRSTAGSSTDPAPKVTGFPEPPTLQACYAWSSHLAKFIKDALKQME